MSDEHPHKTGAGCPQEGVEVCRGCVERLPQRATPQGRSSPHYLHHTLGPLRYLRNPQGFVGAGDGYNRRFNAVIQDFQRKERCVDDTIFWDEDLKKHWWCVIKFLEITGRSGIVLNPEKFQFCAQ